MLDRPLGLTTCKVEAPATVRVAENRSDVRLTNVTLFGGMSWVGLPGVAMLALEPGTNRNPVSIRT